MPTARSPRPSVGPAAGGTSVGSERSIALYVGVGAAVVCVVVIVIVALGGDDSKKSTQAPVEPPTRITAPPPARPAAAPTPEPPPEQSERTQSPQRVVAQDFEEILAQQRLWATVSASDSAIVVRSGACEDEAMRPAIAKFSGQLRESGFSAVQCIAKHGGLVFEIGL